MQWYFYLIGYAAINAFLTGIVVGIGSGGVKRVVQSAVITAFFGAFVVVWLIVDFWVREILSWGSLEKLPKFGRTKQQNGVYSRYRRFRNGRQKEKK